jgi:small subunit ribosomal protein S11
VERRKKKRNNLKNMGKKRIATTQSKEEGSSKKAAVSVKKRVNSGILFVKSTYNNIVCSLADSNGNVICQSSAGAMGFKGAKKGTPFAAAKVGENLGDRAVTLGMKEISAVIKGVGSGRESAVRSFVSKGINIISIKDVTPIPWNGPKPPKPRRV